MSERPESPMATVALHAIVRGRVQGVNFRHFVCRRAISLGLAGYVRNLPDMHSVEVVAESQRERLELLLAQLRAGPRAGRGWTASRCSGGRPAASTVSSEWRPSPALSREDPRKARTLRANTLSRHQRR